MKKVILRWLAVTLCSVAVLSFIGCVADNGQQRPSGRPGEIKPKGRHGGRSVVYTPVIAKLTATPTRAVKRGRAARLVSAATVSFDIRAMPPGYPNATASLPLKCYAVDVINDGGVFKVDAWGDTPLPVFQGGAASINAPFSSTNLSVSVDVNLDPADSTHFFIGTVKSEPIGGNQYDWSGGTIVSIPQ